MSSVPINPDIPAVQFVPDCSPIPTAVILITGPRRSGKSYYARQMAGNDVELFDEDCETDPAAFKRPITTRAVILERAERLSKAAFVNLLGGMKDLGGRLFVVANLEELPADHWLRVLATSQNVCNVTCGEASSYSGIAKVLDP